MDSNLENPTIWSILWVQPVISGVSHMFSVTWVFYHCLFVWSNKNVFLRAFLHWVFSYQISLSPHQSHIKNDESEMFYIQLPCQKYTELQPRFGWNIDSIWIKKHFSWLELMTIDKSNTRRSIIYAKSVWSTPIIVTGADY
jgi:hypothetical protein